jgi:hypothetical protein
VNFFQSHSSSAPPKHHNFAGIITFIFLLATLPVFIWAVATQRIEIRKRAAEEPVATSAPLPPVSPIPSCETRPSCLNEEPPCEVPALAPDRLYCPATPASTLKAQTMEFRVRLGGVKDGSAQGAPIYVKFLKQHESPLQLSEPLTLTHIGNGVYKATATLTNPLPAKTAFRVEIKGEKHTPVTFCRKTGQKGQCTDTEYIIVPSAIPASYVFDFTGIALPPEAGIDQLVALLAKPRSELTPNDLLLGDLNYDGVINGFDFALLPKNTIPVQ